MDDDKETTPNVLNKLLWNHSRGPISLAHGDIISVVSGLLQYNVIHESSLKRKFVGKSYPRNSRTNIPHEQYDDFTVDICTTS